MMTTAFPGLTNCPACRFIFDTRRGYCSIIREFVCFFFFQAEDGIRYWSVTGVQTCALPILCDGLGKILDVEATTKGPESIQDKGAGFIAHTNHFLCSRYARKENFEKSWQDSFPRIAKINELIASRQGRVTVDDVKIFLKDHAGDGGVSARADTRSRYRQGQVRERALDERGEADVRAAHQCPAGGDRIYAEYADRREPGAGRVGHSGLGWKRGDKRSALRREF